MGRAYFIVMVALGLFGAIAGRLQPPPSSSSNFDRYAKESADGGSSESHDSQHRSARDGEAIVLERQPDGHFYADVKLNGMTVNMLVDTGASAIALSKDDAQRAGIATSIGMNENVGEGAGGAVYGDVVEIHRVELGGVEQKDVPAVVLDGGDMSLLGQSFLREFDSVQISGDEMILR